MVSKLSSLKNASRFFLIFGIFICLFFAKELFVFPVIGKEKFVTIINPVRGNEFSSGQSRNYLISKKQYELLLKKGFPATWLIRYDATVFDAEAISFFSQMDKSHELGIFFEVTPGLAQSAGIEYLKGGLFWHDANKIFLSGYAPEERIKLIDANFLHFKNAFGYYPAVIGAWHIDAFSANYMVKKYQISAILLCSDQATTDSYRIWGSYWGMPYYPSKNNILLPAQSLKNKVGAVVLQWAQRDPYLGYGSTAYQSSYSFQINDYYSRGLKKEYFTHLLDSYLENSSPFGQVTIGLENDYLWADYSKGFEEQLDEIKKREDVKVVNAGEFSVWYKTNFPFLSPEGKIEAENYFDSSQKAIWQFSTRYRLGLIDNGQGEKIRDLRIYNDQWSEPNLLTANPWPDLSLAAPAKIDTVQYAEQMVEAPDDLSYGGLIKRFGQQKIPFKTNILFFLLFYSSTLLISGWLLRKNFPFSVMIFLGSLSWSLPMIKSGLVYRFGMGFWGPNAHDGLWHLALINQLAKFKLENPIFSGNVLTNYHFGFDLLLAFIKRLTGISALNLYFQIIPFVFSILSGFLVFKFVKKWQGSDKTAFWATFFVYFGGSFGWIITYFRNRTFGGESLFWANQAISTQLNPPYAFSLILLMIGLNLLIDIFKQETKKNDLRKIIFTSVLLGLLILVKVYAGIIILGSLLVLSFYSILKKEKNKGVILTFFLSSLVAILVFFPFNPEAKSLLVFQPFWFIRSMLFAQDRFFFPKLEEARQVYWANRYWLKWIIAEFLGLAIFLIGNLGTRLVGLGYLLSFFKKKKPDKLNLLITLMIGISLGGTLFFVQKGNPWNTIQFFYYTQFFFSILAGEVVGNLIGEEKKNKSIYKFLLVATLVIITVPTTIISLKNDYLPGRPPTRISIDELEALDFLKKQPEGIVLTFPFDTGKRDFFSVPKPVYSYETTAYVPALAEKTSVLVDEMNLIISQYPLEERKEEINRFFISRDQGWGKEFIKKYGINYIYLVKGQKMEFGEGNIGFKKIFDNTEVKIYKLIEEG